MFPQHLVITSTIALFIFLQTFTWLFPLNGNFFVDRECVFSSLSSVLIQWYIETFFTCGWTNKWKKWLKKCKVCCYITSPPPHTHTHYHLSPRILLLGKPQDPFWYSSFILAHVQLILHSATTSLWNMNLSGPSYFLRIKSKHLNSFPWPPACQCGLSSLYPVAPTVASS